MERITRKIVDEFIRDNEFELLPSQPKLCIPIIDRIYKKMSGGIKFPGIKVDGDVICDGHHRYFAAKIAKVRIDIVPGIKTAATIIADWNSISFEEDDWDTQLEIIQNIEQDAAFNDMTVEMILEMLR